MEMGKQRGTRVHLTVSWARRERGLLKKPFSKYMKMI